MPLISVIIPAYNSQTRIKSTLESVLNQDYKNFELVFVDDASTDETASIAESILSCHDVTFRIVRHTQNMGECASRNTGLENSHGDYVIFIDSDDMAEKNLLSCLYDLIDKYKCDVSFCGMTHKFTNGRPDVKDFMNLRYPYVREGEKFLYMRVLGKKSPHVCSMLFRREFLRDNVLTFHEGCIAGGDVEFQLKALCVAERVSFSNECLYVYMHHSEMGSVRDNDTPEKIYARYDSNTQAQRRAAEFIITHAKSECSRKLAREILLPQSVIKSFTLSAMKDDMENFYAMLNDEHNMKILRCCEKFYTLVRKPDVFFKALMIRNFPGLYYRFRELYRS